VVVAETEQLLQDLHGVLAEARGWRQRAAVVAADAELVAFVWHRAHFGMDEAAEELPMGELRVADQIARALDHSCRDPGRLQELHEPVRILCGGEGGELTVDQRPLRDAPRGGIELAGHGPRRLAQGAARR